ncbi:helicase-related protein [Chryseolinea sp. T2]|uniref:helicase-related protein n=1 Tax=Chryseolinea sp. T2 TaxID=3129255 RepID=UPI00307869D2
MKDKIEQTLLGLKDFQLKTVEYVFSQLYNGDRNKMLIADEVGLGKTIVAKGIIAKAFDLFRPGAKKPTFNVVYVCSNQTLARQNLSKLNFTGNHKAIDYSEEDDRLTGLAYITSGEERNFPFRIKAFTPATSFDAKSNTGKSDERVLLYRLLYSYKDIADHLNSLKWILKGNRLIKDETWEIKIWIAEQFEKSKNDFLRKIRPKVYSEFRKALDETIDPAELPKCFQAAGINYPVKHWTLIKNLCQLGIRSNNYYNYNFARELISSLRFILSKVCLEFLQADIFILDEFQRYKRILEEGVNEEDELSPAIEIAREIFSFEHSKILMLSATPFKPYTHDFDELNGEVHYHEFKTVLKFLMGGKSEEFWKKYEQDRRELFLLMRHPNSLKEQLERAIEVKSGLEKLYRAGIVRTEKLLVSKDRNALIKHVSKEPVTLQIEDIQDFIAMDRVTNYLNEKYSASLSVPLEYVKSSPYPLSFLDSYQHKEKLRKLAGEDQELQRLLRKTKHGWVNLENIKFYKPLAPEHGKHPPNAKLRLLLKETVLNNGWKYLWIPPSIPYYEFEGAFRESWGFSKTLIFSSWKMVPRMVASLVSYEAERLSIGNPKSISEKEAIEDKREYFSKRRSPRPQFTFKVDKEAREPSQMNNFILSYPSPFLVQLYDPASNVTEQNTLPKIKDKIKISIIDEFRNRDLNKYGAGKGDWKKWLWVAPLLLDFNDELIKEWFNRGIPTSELAIDAESFVPDSDETTGKAIHFSFAAGIFKSQLINNLPPLTAEQLDTVAEHLVELTLGSPAVCFLRSALRMNPKSLESLDAAFNVSSAFITMFNKPESIAIVRLHTEASDYWKKVLEYSIAGNIQAMLDEYVYLLANGENLQSIAEMSDFISSILSVRTASVEVDDLKLFIENLSSEDRKRRTMRSHYAVDFGNQKIGSAAGAGRQINIRQAFNSPFRPFVLASTSIGQEGLDFHLYCKKIFHWNLPSNPIDFEQREGRIHRYQGLVIRLNLADKYKSGLKPLAHGQTIWDQIFSLASEEKANAPIQCDLVPFWHTESISDIKIERFVPLYPFSRDVEKFNNMLKILTYYRLTFGQPRQAELVDAFHAEGFSEEDLRNLNRLTINLSPICF